MIVKVTDEAVRKIEEILKHGNDAVVYRRKDGIVVAEQSRKIRYSTDQRNGQYGQ